MNDSTCSIPGCAKPVKARTWCAMHYSRWRTDGDPGEAGPRYNSPTASLADRLRRIGWAVTADGCWEWAGGHAASGYGVLSRGGRKTVTAHRASYEAFVGPIPPGAVVCHRCDNPPCMNPGHLFLGSHADNVTDCRSKDRHARGERNGHAILSPEDVLRIRDLRAAGTSPKILAAKYGVHVGTIYSVTNGQRWRHLVDAAPSAIA